VAAGPVTALADAPAETEVDEKPRIRKRIVDETGLNEPSHGSYAIRNDLSPKSTRFRYPNADIGRHHFFNCFWLNVELLETRQGPGGNIVGLEKINLAGGEWWVWQELETAAPGTRPPQTAPVRAVDVCR
jgi:hypothetical protein